MESITYKGKNILASSDSDGGESGDDGDAPCLSLRDASPANPPPKEHLLVVLKGFFDGGNQASSTQWDRVTLATACGTGDEWFAFDSA